MIVTTSWDDGSLADLKMLHLLNKYNLKATFYISQNSPLHENQIKKIAETQEIGAHTLNHVNLKQISLNQAQTEIIGSKQWLEKITSQSIKMFCYPKGQYNSKILALIKKTEFDGARTIKPNQTRIKNKYEMPTTCYVFPPKKRKRGGGLPAKIHRFLIQLKDFYLYDVISLLKTGIFFGHKNWAKVAKKYFDLTLKSSGVYHLWGHTAEIEKHNLWPQIEDVFKHISNNKNIKYLTNSETIKNSK